MHRRNRPSKFCTTMILGASALFLAYSYNVSATETIYKCICPDGKIVFQDMICPANSVVETIKIDMNQSADNPVGLREHEKQMIAQAHEYAANEQAAQQQIRLAMLNHATEKHRAAQAMAQRPVAHTIVHLHRPAPYQDNPTNYNYNQNNFTFKYVKNKNIN